MDYEVSVSKNEKFVIIDAKAPMTVDLSRRCGIDAHELARKKEIKRFLFDLRGAPNIETVLHNYEFAYQDMQEHGFSRSIRSALLTDPGDSSHDFMETLLLNAGYPVKKFSSEEDAVSWLEE
jgi:hypothetical protein